MNYLDFETSLKTIDEALSALASQEQNEAVQKETAALKKKQDKVCDKIFKTLTPWQVVQTARHPDRLHTRDYIQNIFTEFNELKGDRLFAEDPAIMGGLAYFNDIPVIVIGHEKGRSTKEKIHHNFAYPKPEGYRKALRLMELAQKFDLPIITLIDTPGAYPGIDAEERGQSRALALNLQVMSGLTVPIISIVIGEGGSGGALAIGVADRVAMLQQSIYSVITPEGCASILWRSASEAPKASETMRLTAEDAFGFKLIDAIIPEPKGACHRYPERMLEEVKIYLTKTLNELSSLDKKTLLETRYQKLMSYGMLTAKP
jgi:acetyl-CoA carboxylase carboxyl transferase subunit alpha